MGGVDYLLKKKSRNFKLLLYADNPAHMRVLKYIKRCPDYVDSYIGCWHRLPGEDGREIVTGEGKKHAHVLLDFVYPRGWGAVCDDLRIDFRFCHHMKYKIKPLKDGDFKFVQCKDTLKKGFVYLVHHDDLLKEQYTVSDLFGADRLLVSARREIDEYDSRQVSMARCMTFFQAWLLQQDRSVSVYAAVARFNGTQYQQILRHPLFTSLLCEHNNAIWHKQHLMQAEPTVVRGRNDLQDEIDKQIDRESGWNPFLDSDVDAPF